MELLYYFLKVSACTVLFFAFYVLVLRKLTFFRFNRFYLLITLLISFIIPTLHFTLEREVPQAELTNTPIVLPTAAIADQAFEVPGQVMVTPVLEEGFDFYTLLPYFYFSIVAALLIFSIKRVFHLAKHMKGSGEKINGLKIVAKTKGFTNCSFFNYVFIDQESLSQEELAILLKHEKIHAKQLHSLDKLMMMVIKAILWFNPVVYLYDRALEQAHEYEADEATSQNFGTPEYASLLLRLAVSKSEMPLVHNFVKSPIKERIKMLFNSKSKHMKKLMYLLALPIGLGLLWGFTVKVINVAPERTVGVNQDKPFIQRTKIVTAKGFHSEQITLNTITGKTSVVKLIYNTAKYETPKIWIYVNDKLYTENEALKFNKDFIAKLSEKRGYGQVKDFDLSVVNNEKHAYVFWFGNEPKLSAYTAKNRAIYQKYNGTTIDGKVLEYTYSPISKLMDGFLVKTSTGETLKAFVELKFAKQVAEMVVKDDDVSIKVYNSSYWRDNDYPVLTSYKISKNGKLLYDRWPKTVSNKASGVNETIYIDQKELTKIPIKPVLISSSTMSVDTKNNVTYMTKALMEIGDAKLQAEDMTWDHKSETITAKNATLISKNGDKIVSKSIVYDLKKGAYSAIAAAGIKGGVVVKKNNVSYHAQDSTIVDKHNQTVYLYGNAEFTTNEGSYKGSSICFNQKLNTIKVFGASIVNDKSNSMIIADSMYVNLNTSSGIMYGKTYLK